MTPGASPWIDVPDDWLDAEYCSDLEIVKIQRFLNRKVKAEVIRKHLLAEGIGKHGELEIGEIRVSSFEQKCVIESWLSVTGKAWKEKDEATGLYVEVKDSKEIKTGSVKMIRSIEKDSDGIIYSANFGKIGVGIARLPDNFADEYYVRAVPFLQKIGVKPLSTMAITEADNPKSEEGRLAGAYVWPRYGYTNEDMDGTIKDFLKYLREDRKITLTNEEVSEIKAWSRMIKIADHEIFVSGNKLTLGKDFLLGDDGTGNYSRDIIWQGIIPNISDKNSKGMRELSEKLYENKRK